MNANAVRMSPSGGPFYETWYLTLNHPQSGEAYWLRATLLRSPAGGLRPVGGLWLARFSPEAPARRLALSRSFSGAELSFSQGRDELRIGPGRFRSGAFSGAFSESGHEVSWDLRWNPASESLFLVPPLVRRLRFNASDLSVPGADLRVNGIIRIDGEETELCAAPAGQAHHWGRHYAKAWIWGHCNDFAEAPGSYVETLAVKLVELGGHSRALVMLAAELPEGRFALTRPWDMLLARADFSKGEWRWRAPLGKHVVEARFRAPDADFLCFPYTSPHDERYACHNSCLADAELRLYERRRGGMKLVRELRSSRRAAAEFCAAQASTPDRFVF